MTSNSGFRAGDSPRASSVSAEVEGELRKVRVLIVDDLVDAADSLALLLRRLGYEVRAVYDGASAVATAKEFLPYAILLDLALPKLDGFQVAAQLRQNVELQSVCLIAVSGFGQADDLERTSHAGFDFHLVKPVNLEELLRILSMPPH
jgi:two-component system, sensor histidine kinase